MRNKFYLFDDRFFSEFHDTKHWCPWILGVQFWHVQHFCSDGIPFPFNFVGVSSVPFFFITWALEWPVSSRESLHIILALFGIGNTIVWIFSLRPVGALGHWHDNSSSKKCSGSIFWSCRSFWIFWKISIGVTPGKIFYSESKRFSIDSKQFLVRTGLLKFFELSVPSLVCSWKILHLSHA